MKIYVYPADETGCGYYRAIWPANALKKQGYDINIIMPNMRANSLRGALNAAGELIDIQQPPDADVMVLQRITHKHLVQGIQILRNKGVSVVIDMDDDLSAIHPANPAFIAMHPKHGTQKDHSWQNAQIACDNASFVTVSTDALLARYARHGRGTVVRNCVPERYLNVPHNDSTVIGWGGSIHSHPDDLQTVGASIDQIMNEASFRVVGPGTHVQKALSLSREPHATGVRDIHNEWPTALADLGIGIAPLADTRFNAAKSWLKPLEYSALGVPWIASPRVEYQRLHALGAGLLADRPRQWLSYMRKLVRNPDMRMEMSGKGRDVASSMTIELNAWRWMEAWTRAYEIDH